MSNENVEWTEEKKEKVLKIVQDYIEKHEAWGGEMVAQDDDAQIDAIELACDLAEIIQLEN